MAARVVVPLAIPIELVVQHLDAMLTRATDGGIGRLLSIPVGVEEVGAVGIVGTDPEDTGVVVPFEDALHNRRRTTSAR